MLLLWREKERKKKKEGRKGEEQLCSTGKSIRTHMFLYSFPFFTLVRRSMKIRMRLAGVKV